MQNIVHTGESFNFTLAAFVRLLAPAGPGYQAFASGESQGPLEEELAPHVLSYLTRALATAPHSSGVVSALSLQPAFAS